MKIYRDKNIEEVISVEIEYKILDQENWAKIELTPNEYFEEIDESECVNSQRLSEEYNFDAIPKYFHAVEYLDCKLSEIQYTKLTIVDLSKSAKLVQSETFWNEGNNRIIST